MSSISVFATEVESTEESENSFSDYLYSLQDTLDGIPDAMQQLRDVASSFGQASDATIRTLINAPVKAVASSIFAMREDIRDTVIDALIADRRFMSSIYINPYTKSFFWGKDAGRHGSGVGSTFFYDTQVIGSPQGFYPCNDRTYEFPGSPSSGLTTTYFTSDSKSTFWCRVGTDVIFCDFKSADSIIPVHQRGIMKDGFEYNLWTVKLTNTYMYNNIEYKYNFRVPSTGNESFSDFPSPYSSIDDAVKAFYGFKPSEQAVPNGKGYIRPLTVNINASGNNVYNQNWDNIINNNYITYGDTFPTSIVNNYYYYASSTSTPNYFYDTYPNQPTYLPHDYNVDDITLPDPTFTSDNTFISDIFSSLPFAISAFLLSVFLLSALMLFLRG